MTEAQHKDDEFTVNDVVDNAVVADSDAQLTVTTAQLQATGGARVIGKRINGAQ